MKKVTRKRILCVCSGGNVRSVTLAYILKRIYRYDALACGIKGNSPYTVDYLCKWADRIVLLEETFKKGIPERYHPKIIVYDVGPDVWNQANHQELVDKLYKHLSNYKI